MRLVDAQCARSNGFDPVDKRFPSNSLSEAPGSPKGLFQICTGSGVLVPPRAQSVSWPVRLGCSLAAAEDSPCQGEGCLSAEGEMDGSNV